MSPFVFLSKSWTVDTRILSHALKRRVFSYVFLCLSLPLIEDLYHLIGKRWHEDAWDNVGARRVISSDGTRESDDDGLREGQQCAGLQEIYSSRTAEFLHPHLRWPQPTLLSSQLSEIGQTTHTCNPKSSYLLILGHDLKHPSKDGLLLQVSHNYS